MFDVSGTPLPALFFDEPVLVACVAALTDREPELAPTESGQTIADDEAIQNSEHSAEGPAPFLTSAASLSLFRPDVGSSPNSNPLSSGGEPISTSTVADLAAGPSAYFPSNASMVVTKWGHQSCAPVLSGLINKVNPTSKGSAVFAKHTICNQESCMSYELDSVSPALLNSSGMLDIFNATPARAASSKPSSSYACVMNVHASPTASASIC